MKRFVLHLKDMNEKLLERLLHNYYTDRAGGNYGYQDIITLKNFFHYLVDLKSGSLKTFNLPRYKVGLMFVCLNQPYWPFAGEVLEGARQYFLPDHDVEMMLWSDMPLQTPPQLARALEEIKQKKLADKNAYADGKNDGLTEAEQAILNQTQTYLGATVFPTEAAPWPNPTLLRYNLFLGQEEYLKKFDYIFYCDIDMKFVNIVGDEILGAGLTAAQHPMYALRREYQPPFEPNPESAAHIKRPGIIVNNNGQQKFETMYFAGGFQGGKTPDFIEAMKAMKNTITEDMNHGYTAIWNEESHWNKYLSEKLPSVVLSPSYIFPDSLIDEYYVKVWGKKYPPKLVTLTKKFTTSKEAGEHIKKQLETM